MYIKNIDLFIIANNNNWINNFDRIHIYSIDKIGIRLMENIIVRFLGPFVTADSMIPHCGFIIYYIAMLSL
jgi:hypothetical protein